MFRAGAMVASPVGVLLAGPLIALVGLRGTFIVTSVILLGVLAAIVTNRSIHDFDKEEPGAGMPVEEPVLQAVG